MLGGTTVHQNSVEFHPKQKQRENKRKKNGSNPLQDHKERIDHPKSRGEAIVVLQRGDALASNKNLDFERQPFTKCLTL